MIMSEISEADFLALLCQTGIPLTEAQQATLREGYGYVASMLAHLHTPRGREAEPAHIFYPEQRA
jgi:hypothetical protein